MDNFNALAIFVTVVDRGSFSAAASALSLTTSAVSKRITQLEQQLATRLLHRSTRALSLTDAGERYYEHAQQAVQAAARAQDAVSQLQGEPAGKLRICAPMVFGNAQLSTLVSRFLARYPNIEIDLVLHDPILNLIEHRFDLAIGSGDLPGERTVVRQLTQANSVICASPSYVDSHPPIHTPEDLLGHNCLVNSASSNAHDWQFTNSHQHTKIKVRGNYSVNNSQALAQAVCNGLGIARLPSFIAAPLIESGALRILLSAYALPSKPIYLCYAQRKFMPQKVRLFIDFCIEQLS
ncbi:MAG: LysR substrate-binding domain-containing protein [Pseudomonadales bacterium]